MILIGGMTWRNESTGQIKPLVKDCIKRGKVLGGISVYYICNNEYYISANSDYRSCLYKRNLIE